MTRSKSFTDNRAEQILKAVVEMYIAHPEPVGASAVTRQYDFSLGQASIRNVMADLEEEGYLTQPHTSAGREPTDKGYRRYVDSLVSCDPLPGDEKQNILSAAFSPELREMADMFTGVTKALAGLSHQAGLVGLSSWAMTPIKSMKFVSLEDKLALAVMITTGGEICSQMIKLNEVMTQNALEKITNFFNVRFAGKSLSAIRETLMEELKQGRNRADEMISRALAMAEEIEASVAVDTHDNIYLDGASNLIAQPFATMDINKIKALFKTLDEKATLVELLNECLKSDGINLIIGSESDVEELSDFSLVTHAFKGADGTAGAVGVIGPKQMNYGKVIALVAYTAEQISRRLVGEKMEQGN